MNRLYRVLLVILVSLGMPASARADFFSIPELVGPGPTYNEAPIEIDFDLGQEYSEVINVLLMLEATVTPLTYETCGYLMEPQPCELQVVNTGFLVRLEGPVLKSTTALIDGFGSHPTKQAGVFQRAFLEYSFDQLRDGRGTITVYWNGVSFIPEQIIENFTPPTGVITDAALFVEATPIPEPSGIIQLGAGALFLCLLGRSRSCR